VTYRYIDPPGGWQFGFPKRFDGDEKAIDAWLLANGYPPDWIDLFPGGVKCRIIQFVRPVPAWER
jgi:hypothetical protein